MEEKISLVKGLVLLVLLVISIVGLIFTSDNKLDIDEETPFMGPPKPNNTENKNITQFEKFIGGSNIEEVRHNSQVSNINN